MTIPTIIPTLIILGLFIAAWCTACYWVHNRFVLPVLQKRYQKQIDKILTQQEEEA